MDNATILAAISIMLGIKSSDVARAEAAAQTAQEAKDAALAKSYGITVSGTSLQITETTDGNGGGE